MVPDDVDNSCVSGCGRVSGSKVACLSAADWRALSPDWGDPVGRWWETLLPYFTLLWDGWISFFIIKF